MKNQPLLNYRIVGRGCPVLFLHGFLEDRTMWDFLSNSLPGHQLILVDLPGHGASSHSPDVHSINEMARAVARLLEALKLETCSCVGHSLGGYVGLELAESFPSLVSKLVLLNSHPWSDSPSKKRERERVAAVVAKNKSLFLETAIPNLYVDPTQHQKHIRDLIESARELPAEKIMAVIHAMRKRPNSVESLRKKGQNALIIHGKKDPLIDTEKMINSFESTENQLMILPRAGHMSHQESSAEVVAILRRFLAPEKDN
ncbi:MAG: alpha/beta fold hydrolase [Bacteroidota bacterium]